MVFLDTSACIESLHGNPLPAEVEGHVFGVSTVAEMELWAGVKLLGQTKKGEREVYRVERLLESVQILPFDSAAAKHAAGVLADLEKRGMRIDDPDAMIAGHALALDLPVLTTNPKHFKRVRGLRVIIWR